MDDKKMTDPMHRPAAGLRQALALFVLLAHSLACSSSDETAPAAGGGGAAAVGGAGGGGTSSGGAGGSGASGGGIESDERPRLIVTTDIGGDPDDQQSLVRLLLYANEFQIEALIASASGTPGELGEAVTRPELIEEQIAAYGLVFDQLAQHAEGFPTAEHLASLVVSGNPERGTDFIGEGHDTAGSNKIIEVVDQPDSRPVNVAIWGGQTDLAQAIFRVKTDRSPAEFQTFLSRLRIHDIADQDEVFDWIHGQAPGLWYVLDLSQTGVGCESVFRGMFLGGDLSLVTEQWLQEHVTVDHGALGALYPAKGLWTCNNGIDALKEGDTPSWFYFMAHGVNEPEQPSWGGFGGRFELDGDVYRDAQDHVGSETTRIATVHRWRKHFQGDFAARLDWCVQPVAAANHAPAAVLQGDGSRDVVHLSAAPSSEVVLSAVGSSDPDGNDLSYTYWSYPEAGSYGGAVTLETTEAEAWVAIPADAAGTTIHVVLEVTDSGIPALTSLRRAVIDVN